MEWKVFSMEWKWNGRKLPHGKWKNLFLSIPYHALARRQRRNLLVFELFNNVKFYRKTGNSNQKVVCSRSIQARITDN